MLENSMGDPEYYEGKSVDELRKLMLSGDGSACAYYIKRRYEENSLTEDDVTYLDTAVKNLDSDAALCGYRLFGQKGGLYEDEEKFIACAAILEQDGFNDAHKAIKKIFKKNSKAVNEADKYIYMTAVGRYLIKLIPNGGCDGLFIDIDKADKTIAPCDPKHAFTVKIKAATEAGGIFGEEVLYILYLRDKYVGRSVTLLGNRFDEFLKNNSAKFKIRSYRIRVERNIVHKMGEYGGELKDNSVRERSDGNITISVSDERLETAVVCSHCGGKLDADGVCVNCGKKAATQVETDSGNIKIHRSKNMEALHCTQCGGAVHIDDNNKTAYCPYCGTTFIINGNALDGGVMGIDFNNLRADMPENATLPEIKFIRARICNDISTILPDSFVVMPDKFRRLKYPNNPPDFIYMTPDTCVNLCMSFREQLADEDVFRFGQSALTGLRNIRQDARFGDIKQLRINDHNILYFDFLSAALDQSIYNAMFFFSFDGEQSMGSWNCLGKDRWFWAPIFEHAVKTMEF